MTGAVEDPIFVGGTQRSGTHATAGLIGAHPRVAHLPREMKFHAHPEGLPGVIRGRVSPRAFAKRMRGSWWSRPYREGRTRGLYKTVPQERFERALEEFLAECGELRPPLRPWRWSGANLVGPSRRLVKALFDPIAEEQGAERWAEMSPRNAEFARELRRMFREMKLVHTVRDGRDVAASLIRLPFGPDTALEGLERWERRLRREETATRELPPAQLFPLRLEELLLTKREETLRALLDFLDLDEAPELRALFDSELTAENGHLGRWRVELSDPERVELDRRYKERLERLAADGISALPEPEPLPPEFAAVPAAEPGSTIDPWADGRAEEA